jgi:hypothetical protein
MIYSRKFWINISPWLSRPSIQWLCRKNRLLASAVNISNRRSEDLACSSFNTLTPKQPKRHLWHVILCSTQNTSFKSMCRYETSYHEDHIIRLYNMRLKAIYLRPLYDKYQHSFPTISTRLLLYYFFFLGATVPIGLWPTSMKLSVSLRFFRS